MVARSAQLVENTRTYPTPIIILYQIVQADQMLDFEANHMDPTINPTHHYFAYQ